MTRLSILQNLLSCLYTRDFFLFTPPTRVTYLRNPVHFSRYQCYLIALAVLLTYTLGLHALQRTRCSTLKYAGLLGPLHTQSSAHFFLVYFTFFIIASTLWGFGVLGFWGFGGVNKKKSKVYKQLKRFCKMLNLVMLLGAAKLWALSSRYYGICYEQALLE